MPLPALHRRGAQSGVSLIESMIGLAIGGTLMAGLVTAWWGMHQTQQVQQRLEASAEALRFGAWVVSSKIRQAHAVESVGMAGGSPWVRLRTGPGGYGCHGAPITGPVVLELWLHTTSAELRCQTLPGTTSAQTLVHPVTSLQWTCLQASAAGGIVSIPDCAQATALEVQLGVPDPQTGQARVQRWVVALRPRAFP
jgi:prepilin-type N-terminal cleavage/methylation domain-containing protein